MQDYSYNFIKFCGQELSVECSAGRSGYKAQSVGHGAGTHAGALMGYAGCKAQSAGHADDLTNTFRGLAL